MISTNTKYGIAGVSVLIAFSVGRYSVNQTPTITKNDVQTINADQNRDKQTHIETTVTTTKKPDGTTTIVKQIDTTVSDKTDTKVQDNTKIQDTSTPARTTKYNLAFLAGDDIHNPLSLTYGLSISREILGPITIGAFVLRSGVIGISLGLDF